MSGFDDHPGGGFSHVDGYNDPAGSQAEQERLRQEDEQRRQREEAGRQQQEAEMQALQGVGRSSSPHARPRAKQPPPKANPSSGPGKKPPRPAPQPPFNGFFGLVAFLAAGFWAANKVGGEGDGKWLAGLLAGLAAGAIAGRFYKQILALAALVLGLWILGRPDSSEEKGDPLGGEYSATAMEPLPDLDPPDRPYQPFSPPNPVVSSPPATHPPAETAAPRFRKPPLDSAPHRPNTTPLPPGVAGSLFGSSDDFDIYRENVDGKPSSLFVYHAPVIEYFAISHLEYHRAFERVVVVKEDGTRVDLGVPIGANVRQAWEELNYVSIVRTKDGKRMEGYRFDLEQVPPE